MSREESLGMKSIEIEFPLRGEWSSPNTPGTRIPSHGTNQLASRYAYDFLKVDWKKRGTPCYSVHPLRYLLLGVSIEDCYCYGNPIYAPCDGIVVKIETSCEERKRAYLISDFYHAFKNRHYDFEKDTLKKMAGNYIILKHKEGYYFAFCHLQPSSISVTLDQTIKKGELLGNIGHTGNSMFPHLHFQVMDDVDMQAANGVLCVFEHYERFSDGVWEHVYHGIPKADERIRFIK